MSKRIISVNAHRAMNYLLQTIFENEFEFIPLSDPFEAIHYIRQGSTEALIIDVDFQPQQNWELIEHLKSSKLFSTPVLVLSSSNTEEFREKCLQFGIDEIFFKPFNPVEFITAVKALALPVGLSA